MAAREACVAYCIFVFFVHNVKGTVISYADSTSIHTSIMSWHQSATGVVSLGIGRWTPKSYRKSKCANHLGIRTQIH